ncbi:hypothetical protein [Fischerella sp. PCC 9605]|uniref:hypothetical protein n=1 Tax=Fischerella sp. PCC 9605 TaxID=1173024 RepID=UPI00047B21A3|nr:hypothetical protein [Fischerella sp. PCC 9605]
MLNLLKKFLPARQLRLPLLGLLLILGVVGERAKPVLSSQFARLHAPTPQEFSNQITTRTWLQRNSSPDLQATDKAVRLRRVLAKSDTVPSKVAVESKKASAQIPVNQQTTYTWLQRNSPISTEVPSESLSPELAAAPTTKPRKSAPKASIKTTEVGSKVNFPKRNGIYLYGQSPQPGQLGQGYIIFEKRQSQVIGALYMPDSEFSCFKGTLNPSGKLAMTVRGYPGEFSPLQVAARDGLMRMNDDQPFTYDHSVALQNYYRLRSISSNDREILQMCKSEQ